MNKEELELQKLKKEVDNLSFEKWKFYFGFIPIIVLLGTILYNLYELRTKNYQYDESRKDKFAINYENNYFKETDRNKKLEIAKRACKNDKLDTDTKSFFCQEVGALLKNLEIEDKSNEIIEKNSKKIASGILTKLDKLETKIEELEEENKTLGKRDNQSDFSKNETEIKELNQKLDSLLQNNPIIKETAQVVDSLTNKINANTDNAKTPPLKNKILVEKESWFKENYYRQYGKTRISLNDFHKGAKKALIEIKLVNDSETESIGKLNIKEGENKKIVYGGFIYEITFQRIGNAGKNPFTKAVYFKYRKYEK